jgi:hypothetical protein
MVEEKLNTQSYMNNVADTIVYEIRMRDKDISELKDEILARDEKAMLLYEQGVKKDRVIVTHKQTLR